MYKIGSKINLISVYVPSFSSSVTFFSFLSAQYNIFILSWNLATCPGLFLDVYLLWSQLDREGQTNKKRVGTRQWTQCRLCVTIDTLTLLYVSFVMQVSVRYILLRIWISRKFLPVFNPFQLLFEPNSKWNATHRLQTGYEQGVSCGTTLVL
jgi:hypothetical protein